MSHQPVETADAPAAIGPYSQAIVAGGFLYISGQIPLDPATGELVTGDFAAAVEQVFANLAAVAAAAGATLDDAVRITLYLTNIDDFATVNQVMEAKLNKPYPARAAIGVAALPKGAAVEADAILALG
jgi:reactive intermediate/imine deaminase